MVSIPGSDKTIFLFCIQILVLHSGFFQVGITALANLTAKFAGDDHPRTFFSLEKVYNAMNMCNTVCIIKNRANL